MGSTSVPWSLLGGIIFSSVTKVSKYRNDFSGRRSPPAASKEWPLKRNGLSADRLMTCTRSGDPISLGQMLRVRNMDA